LKRFYTRNAEVGAALYGRETLRSATSLARLRRDQGNEARELLALVYGWFTGGLEILDLREAKTLLDELSP
jgi:predicted ATPase